MDSGSQSDRRSQRSPDRFAEFVGTLIALLTLAVPAIAITQYSSRAQVVIPPTYSISRSQE